MSYSINVARRFTHSTKFKVIYLFVGQKPAARRLLPTAVPSLFPWTQQISETPVKRKSRALCREKKRLAEDESCRRNLESSFLEQVEMPEETICIHTAERVEDDMETDNSNEIVLNVAQTQTPPVPMFYVYNFAKDDSVIHFHTGLESYLKFLFVLRSLGPAAYCLRYISFQIHKNTVSVENQLFMTLMKLRRYTTNFELSKFFNISESSVKNIVYTWIIFMSKQWREVDIWPCRELVKHFAPADFKNKFPSTRIIVDGTECPVKKPGAPRAQQATFSSYKNRNIVKVLVGSTPGGLVNYISPVYGGCTSDRQIVERSNIVSLCDPGDSVMADKGFNVQDLFAKSDVTVNIPTFLKKRNRISGKVLMKDRKISSKRVHIERIIGLGKTYKILTNAMNSTETKLSTHIIFCCYMLCNFRTCIVPTDA